MERTAITKEYVNLALSNANRLLLMVMGFIIMFPN